LEFDLKINKNQKNGKWKNENIKSNEFGFIQSCSAAL
jgi:hypothetical protein